MKKELIITRVFGWSSSLDKLAASLEEQKERARVSSSSYKFEEQ
jgi:hypothetical protein